MTPTQLLTMARRRYNAVGDNYFSDDELLDAIYEAEMQLALETECIEKRFDTVSVASQREYALPTANIRIDRITYDGQRLDIQDFIEDDMETGNDEATTSTGTPSFYSIFNDTLFLRPAPSESGKTIQVYSIDEPSIPLITSTLDVPSRFHPYMIDYLLMAMFGKDQNHQMAVYHRDRWDKNVIDAKRWQMKRFVGERYPVVKDEENAPYQNGEIL